MKYLSVEQILLIHSIIIDETGGLHGIRDRDALLSLEGLPRQKFGGKELYVGVFQKAAVYACNIVMGHPFVDGNKRTGMVAASIFLEINGYKISVKHGEIEKFALRIVKRRLDIEKIVDWLKKNSRKIKK